MFLRIFKPEMRRCAGMLCWLTALFVFWQLAFFLVHFKVTELLDSLVSTSIVLQLLYPVILVPVMLFIGLQFAAYVFLVMMVVFMASSVGELMRLSSRLTYLFAVMCLLTVFAFLLAHNAYFYPASFFAILMQDYGVSASAVSIIFFGTLAFLIIFMMLAYVQFFKSRRFSVLGFTILTVLGALIVMGGYDAALPWLSQQRSQTTSTQKPNVILIGLDSLRPDFTHFGGRVQAQTPNTDAFLKQGLTFTNAYTPLARTFPAWVSILTSKHPVHSSARNNLVASQQILKHDTMARYFQRLGYETIYATDEKRFSNITRDYGFDRVLGPEMGVNDFLLGGLGDFPMVNLILHTPAGRFLLPYHYGNRAVHITYQPGDFLQQVRAGLLARPDKPVFLAVHLCLSHWPFSWANDRYRGQASMPVQYESSVAGVDRQLGELMTILKGQGLLQNSWVVLLSDHGTALGLPHDRLTDLPTYRGDPVKINWVPALKLSGAKEYTINTTYGQGTNILSLPQYRVLLSLRRFGGDLPAQSMPQVASLLDLWPTLIEAIHGPAVTGLDGQTLFAGLGETPHDMTQPRALFLETGDSMNEIETDHIYIEKVIKREIGIYRIDAQNGLLTMDPPAAESIVKNKQLAIMSGDWMLAHFPPHKMSRFTFAQGRGQRAKLKTEIVPAYFVVANLKTGEWTIDLNSPLAKTASAETLLKQLRGYYPGEL